MTAVRVRDRAPGGPDDFTDSNTGSSATALLGVPFGDSCWGPNLMGGLGISHYGSTGINIRLGADQQPWFIPE